MKNLIINEEFIFWFLIPVFNYAKAISNEIISNIEDHWNQIDTMSGQFKQEDS